MSYRLLIVDDDPQFLELMRTLLDEEGYRVELCPSGDGAYELARALQPDVITLDLLMPGPSGWQVLQSIKSDPSLAATPVLVISGEGAELAQTTARLRELDYPRVEVIAKPFEVDELLSRVAEAALRSGDPPDNQ